MARYQLTPAARKAIADACDNLFDKAKVRFLGAENVKRRLDKRIYIGVKPELTMPAIYRQAALEERVKPDDDALSSMIRIAEGYFEAQRESIKSQVTKAVDAFLRDAERRGIETSVETVLGGQLSVIWQKAKEALERVVDTESTQARNMGTLEGITRVNDAAGISDPVVYFIVVRDNDLCEECRRLHLLEDQVTPRVWYLSEVGHGYHRRGDEEPKIGGLHPLCRCSIQSLLPGYGFKNGRLSFIAPGHNELRNQRG